MAARPSARRKVRRLRLCLRTLATQPRQLLRLSMLLLPPALANSTLGLQFPRREQQQCLLSSSLWQGLLAMEAARQSRQRTMLLSV